MLGLNFILLHRSITSLPLTSPIRPLSTHVIIIINIIILIIRLMVSLSLVRWSVPFLVIPIRPWFVFRRSFVVCFDIFPIVISASVPRAFVVRFLYVCLLVVIGHWVSLHRNDKVQVRYVRRRHRYRRRGVRRWKPRHLLSRHFWHANKVLVRERLAWDRCRSQYRILRGLFRRVQLGVLKEEEGCGAEDFANWSRLLEIRLLRNDWLGRYTWNFFWWHCIDIEVDRHPFHRHVAIHIWCNYWFNRM